MKTDAQPEMRRDHALSLFEFVQAQRIGAVFAHQLDDQIVGPAPNTALVTEWSDMKT